MAYPVSESILQAAEQALGRKLPDPLRNRLLRDNGGEAEALGEGWQLHPVWDPTDKRTIRKTANHIMHETQVARQWTGFPKDAIAIASNNSGDLLILRPGREQLEFWNHETRQVKAVTDLNW